MDFLTQMWNKNEKTFAVGGYCSKCKIEVYSDFDMWIQHGSHDERLICTDCYKQQVSKDKYGMVI